MLEMLLIDKKKTEEEQEEMGRNTGDGGAATIELEDATHILSKKKSTPMNAYKCTNNYTPVFTETARARRPDFSVEALKAQFTFPLKTVGCKHKEKCIVHNEYCFRQLII